MEINKLQDIHKSLQESAYGQALLELLHYINQDPFWRAQITHLRIDAQGKIIMNTQVSKQNVEFGKPQNIAQKFAKLQLFYHKIIPYKGWNTYKRVNLEFTNQIVCE